jgi:hypothetical protein
MKLFTIEAIGELNYLQKNIICAWRLITFCRWMLLEILFQYVDSYLLMQILMASTKKLLL